MCTNQDFKDALAAAALAGGEDAPVITTNPNNLSKLAADKLADLGVTKVIIVGSTSDIKTKVETDIKAIKTKPEVVRISANNASAKAVEASKATTLRSKTVIIATQKSFKDALSISPYAYATHSPIRYLEPALSPRITAPTESPAFAGPSLYPPIRCRPDHEKRVHGEGKPIVANSFHYLT